MSLALLPTTRGETHSSQKTALRDDVLRGLLSPQKRIDSKYLYDAQGSRLFERICQLEEYYLTRVESQIMAQRSGEMAARIGRGAMLIEYGSGSSLKTRLLLDELADPAAYVPIDISAAMLRATAAKLTARYPALEVLPVAADFTGRFRLPTPRHRVARRVVYFPGSTLGNFGPLAAARLLCQIAQRVGPGGGLLLGLDLKKDPRGLWRAYSDREGVTRQFNLNLLRRLNRELGANFNLNQFAHHAFYNATLGRMESHLVSCRDQTVSVCGRAIRFIQGETIHTENSYKYDLNDFPRFAATTGFSAAQVWTDRQKLFSVLYCEV